MYIDLFYLNEKKCNNCEGDTSILFFFDKNNFPFTFLRYSFTQLFASRPTISLSINRPAGHCLGHFWQKK